MQAINGALNFVFDLLLLAFLGLPPLVELSVISVIFAVIALLVFKKISNQKGIRAAKDKIIAHLLEVLLYQENMRVVLLAQVKILRYNLAYLGHNSVPMMVLVLPFVFVVMNLDPRYRYDPVEPGETATITATLREGVSFDDLDANLEVPDGVDVGIGPVRAPKIRTVDWTVRADEAGVYPLRVVVDGEAVEKRLVVGERVKMLAPKRESRPLWLLANPGEPPIPASSPVEIIAIDYERSQTIPVLGIDMHYLVVFLIVSLVFGFAIKGVLGVEI